MLIGNIIIIDTGIRIFDVDGSSIDLSAKDALKLQHEIRLPHNYQKLIDAMSPDPMHECRGLPSAFRNTSTGPGLQRRVTSLNLFSHADSSSSPALAVTPVNGTYKQDTAPEQSAQLEPFLMCLNQSGLVLQNYSSCTTEKRKCILRDANSFLPMAKARGTQELRFQWWRADRKEQQRRKDNVG